jgi:tRNA dimethylallyltransferase
MARPHIIVVLGPTASGKTSLAVRLSKKFSGEVVSADSRQIYRHLDIGTGKTTKKEMAGIAHYCIDIADPKKIFSVDEYRRAAEAAITNIYARGKIPIIAGGTGFYIDAILYGTTYPIVPPDWKLRARLEKHKTQTLFRELQKLDPRRAAAIDSNNRRRLIRAIEIIKKAGWIPTLTKKRRFDALIIGIKTNPALLRKKITKRLAGWFRVGLVDEVKNLHEKYKLSWKRLEEIGLDYRIVALYLQKKLLKKEMVQKTDTEIWHYAKRQMTYFKKMENVHWVTSAQSAEKLVKEFLN